MNKRKNDFILIAVLIAVCLGAFLTINIRSMKNKAVSDGSSDKQLIISVDNEVILDTRLSYFKDSETKEELSEKSTVYNDKFLNFSKLGLEVRTENGYNIIEYDENDGKSGVRCSESDCPDKVCVDTGLIYDETKVIVCLPHRLTVRIEALSEA